MKASRPMRGQLLGMALLFSGTLLVGAQPLHAQQTCDATRFLAVNSWLVSVSITGTGNGTVNTPGNVYTYSVQQNIQIGPATLTPSATDPALYTGPENVTVTINDRYTNTVINPPAPNLTFTSTLTANGFSALGDLTASLGGANLEIGAVPLFCGYAFNADFYFSPGTLTNNPGSSSTGRVAWGPGNIPNMLDPPAALQAAVSFPTKGSILTGTTTFDAPPFEGNPWEFPGEIVHWTITWTFVPNPESLDLLVTIPKYLSWRPSGGQHERDTGITPLTPTGNLLGISAQLVDKKTQQPTEFGPDQITFSLAPSHQPGVAMNWPPKNKLIQPSPPDMSFKNLDPTLPTVINPGFTLNEEGTQADFFPPDPSLSNPHADILLIPYDWGGWAKLNVTAMVAGFAIKGHLVVPGVRSDPNETDILLPHRQPSSVIADQWKAQNNASGLADDNDSEKEPNGDNGPGDGLTLYEEYRGFYMGHGCGKDRVAVQPEGSPGAACEHVEGNPNTKNLFVVNRIGAYGIDGLGLFAFASGLTVHYRGLTLGEIGVRDRNDGSSYRMINFNNSGLPLHVTDQHAVILDWGSTTEAGGGSGTVPTPDAPCNIPSEQCGMLPKHADHIEIDPSLLDEPESLSSPSQIDIHVAHELSHSASVYHHGDGIDHFEFWSLDANGDVQMQPLNDQRQLVGSPQKITVIEEDQDPSSGKSMDVSELNLSEADPHNPKDLQGNPMGGRLYSVGNLICPGQVQVRLGGESSGDVEDLMRYSSTGAYIPAGFPNVRVFMVDVWDSPGNLTDHPGGTGINDPNNKPRPHFGDAIPNAPYLRGNDRSQVDVNDSHTEIQRGQFVCPP